MAFFLMVQTFSLCSSICVTEDNVVKCSPVLFHDFHILSAFRSHGGYILNRPLESKAQLAEFTECQGRKNLIIFV